MSLRKCSPFTVSLVLHLAALALLVLGGEDLSRTEEPVLNVNLLSEFAQVSEKKVSRNLKTKRKPVEKKQSVNEVNSLKQSNQTRVSDEKNSLLNVDKIKTSYFDYLRSALDMNKSYPLRAKRLQLQGTVIVLMSLRQNGSVESVNIRKSSASDILDQAALKLVEKSAPFREVPNFIDSKEFEVPIEWYL